MLARQGRTASRRLHFPPVPRHYTPAVNPLKTYDYLLLTRRRILDAVRSLTPEQHRQRFPFGVNDGGNLLATLTHIMISEWCYLERLQGRTLPPYDQWLIKYENPPAFETIDAMWPDQGERVRAASPISACPMTRAATSAST